MKIMEAFLEPEHVNNTSSWTSPLNAARDLFRSQPRIKQTKGQTQQFQRCTTPMAQTVNTSSPAHFVRDMRETAP